MDGGEARGTVRTAPDAPPEITATGEVRPRQMQDGAPRKLLKQFRVVLPDSEGDRQLFAQKLDEAKKRKNDDSEPLQIAYANQAPVQYMFLFLMLGVPLLLMAFAYFMFRRTRDQFVGGGFLNSFSRSTAKRYEPSDQQTTFNDVAGLGGVKADLQEIVDFLKNPEKFQKLGGRIPKGVAAEWTSRNGQNVVGAGCGW